MPSSIVKRQRRRKRLEAGDDLEPEFQVAPMVDVLLVLLLFFMSITSTELLKKVRNLQLAEAKNATVQNQDSKINEIVINVGWNAVNSTAIYTMDGVVYPSADGMQAILTARAEKNSRAYVLIRADKNVEYSNEADVMNVCAAAGIGTVTFAVLTGGEISNRSGAAHDGNPPASQ